MNARRGELIHKEIYGEITEDEAKELAELQEGSAKAVDEAFPLSFDVLDRLEKLLEQQSNGNK